MYNFFRPGGILVCKLEGASFWEKTPAADYLPHHLTLPEGTVYIISVTERDNRNYMTVLLTTCSLKVSFYWLLHVNISILIKLSYADVVRS